jgi:hypothetical protein
MRLHQTLGGLPPMVYQERITREVSAPKHNPRREAYESSILSTRLHDGEQLYRGYILVISESNYNLTITSQVAPGFEQDNET